MFAPKLPSTSFHGSFHQRPWDNFYPDGSWIYFLHGISYEISIFHQTDMKYIFFTPMEASTTFDGYRWKLSWKYIQKVKTKKVVGGR